MRDKQGWEPFHKAVWGGDVCIIHLLLQMGADAASVSHAGWERSGE